MDLIHNTLFGFPVVTTKIDKTTYDKKSIISTIEKNFKLNKERNSWDKGSILHHAYNDFSNPKYHYVDFDTLIPVYKETLISIFKGMDISSTFDFDFRIVNYTCMSNSNYMRSHVHPKDFTAVHYIQFDKKHHTPTIFENSLPHIDYINELSPQLTKILSKKDNLNSWTCGKWRIDTEEDDFCFSPAYLKHRIETQTSKNKNRITIILNIYLE